MARDFAISSVWRAWVLENLNHDIAPGAIIKTLMDRGLTEAAARREVALVADGYARQLHAVVKLMRHLQPPNPTLDERTTLDPETFWSRHWEASRPLVVRGLVARWTDLSLWSFDRWRRDWSHLPLEIEVERDPTRHGQGRFEQSTLGEYLGRFRTDDEAPVDDTVYCIARNRNAMHEAWHRLLHQLAPDPALFDLSRHVGATNLWLGPRGTLTPLHQDATNIFFCQLVGRKRVQLISPLVTELWSHLDDYYVEGDLAHVPPGTPILEVELAAGDGLFIPAGWFHRVVALDPSVSYTLLNFRRANSFGFLTLGSLLRDPALPPG